MELSGLLHVSGALPTMREQIWCISSWILIQLTEDEYMYKEKFFLIIIKHNQMNTCIR